MKNAINIIVIIAIILLTAWMLYMVVGMFTGSIVQEPFDVISDKSYGNLISSGTNKLVMEPAQKPLIIKLPGEFKITGFTITGYVSGFIMANDNKTKVYYLPIEISGKSKTIIHDTIPYHVMTNLTDLTALYPGMGNYIMGFKIDKTMDNKPPSIAVVTNNTDAEFYALTFYREPKYRLSFADRETDINNKDMLTVYPGELSLNMSYTDYTNFDNGNKAKYVGSVAIIEQVYTDANDMRPIFITDWNIYGMSPFAQSYDYYSKIPRILPNSKPVITGDIVILSFDKDYKVGYLELLGNIYPTAEYTLRVQYTNSYDNNTNIYNVTGPVQGSFSRASKYIFFDTPIIAKTIHLHGYANKPVETVMQLFTPGYDATSLMANGVATTSRDKNAFLLEHKQYDDSSAVSGDKKCPNIGQMVQRQLQAHQICEALEQKDKLANGKRTYEDSKIYLAKLMKQDKEIKMLSDKITAMIERKNELLKQNSMSLDAEKLDMEIAKINKLKQDAIAYKSESTNQPLSLKVNMNPQFNK